MNKILVFNGYVRSNGMHVAGEYNRLSQSNTQTDNYNASGNANPYTGEVGYKHAAY